MYNHGPTCLEGPVSRNRWWQSADASEADPAPSAVETVEPAPGIRLELVERVRREIAAGVYETPEKWEIALDRLLDDLER
jgi:negative regulator of flagellin synthesis FlgM